MASAQVRALPSKGEINRCGAYLADGSLLRPGSKEWYAWRLDLERITASRQVVSDFRAAHQRPLGIASEGLRKIVRSELGSPPVVSQRLKRLPRIVRKLARMENSMLARLEDIGGCRAIVADADELERVRVHLEKTWDTSIVRRRDYVETPNGTGYRALHFVVEKYNRRIEVQLRTRAQQRWANAIEAADSRLNLNLKDGTGPESMLEYFRTASLIFYNNDYGITNTPELLSHYEATVDRVITDGYYTKRRTP